MTPERETVTLDAGFNGPRDSAHGGYTCGVVAGLLGGGQARVSLRAPPPLGRELDVVRGDGKVELRDGDRPVADGEAVELGLDPTEAVDPERAADAARAGYERWRERHPFPTCFACGPERRTGDGLGLFPGPLGDGRYAAAWTPDATLAGGGGAVRPEYAWAALDCPSSAPVANFGEGPPIVLARLDARIERPILVGAPHAVVAWPLAVDGRKRHAGCAVFDAGGGLLALSQALWIELRAPAT